MSENDQEQRTEEPTGKQVEKFREKGDVAKGRDLSALVSLFAATSALVLGWPIIGSSLTEITQLMLSRLQASEDLGAVLILAGKAVILSTAPVALSVMVFGVVAEICQVGLNLTFKPIAPNFSKLNPLPRLPQLFFSFNTLIELVKSLVKVIIIGFLAFRVLIKDLEGCGRLAGLSSNMLLYKLGEIALRILIQVGLALVVIAIIDLLIERFRHNKKMKMTKQEVKQEHKDQDGDPLIKSRLRGKQRELSRGRMMEKVMHADVVVVNPTHFSVAIGYRMSEEAAPRILAMGRDDLAMRIRERARHLGIPVVSNPPLARGLYANGKLGAYIPPEYYRAVASLLAWVYSITGRAA